MGRHFPVWLRPGSSPWGAVLLGGGFYLNSCMNILLLLKHRDYARQQYRPSKQLNLNSISYCSNSCARHLDRPLLGRHRPPTTHHPRSAFSSSVAAL